MKLRSLRLMVWTMLGRHDRGRGDLKGQALETSNDHVVTPPDTFRAMRLPDLTPEAHLAVRATIGQRDSAGPLQTFGSGDRPDLSPPQPHENIDYLQESQRYQGEVLQRSIKESKRQESPDE